MSGYSKDETIYMWRAEMEKSCNQLDERSYEVETASGTFRRNTLHLRKSNEAQPTPEPSRSATAPAAACAKEPEEMERHETQK